MKKTIIKTIIPICLLLLTSCSNSQPSFIEVGFQNNCEPMIGFRTGLKTMRNQELLSSFDFYIGITEDIENLIKSRIDSKYYCAIKCNVLDDRNVNVENKYISIDNFPSSEMWNFSELSDYKNVTFDFSIVSSSEGWIGFKIVCLSSGNNSEISDSEYQKLLDFGDMRFTLGGYIKLRYEVLENNRISFYTESEYSLMAE